MGQPNSRATCLPRLPEALLSQKDEFGFSSLTVATYLGDYVAAELLLKEGAVIVPDDITAFMGDAPVKLSSVVELAVRRSSMLIMLGTGRERLDLAPTDTVDETVQASRCLHTCTKLRRGSQHQKSLHPQTRRPGLFWGACKTMQVQPSNSNT